LASKLNIDLRKKLIRCYVWNIWTKREKNKEWRRLHNEALHSLYRSPNIVIKSRRLIRMGHVARMEKGRSAFKILTGTPARKRPLGRPRRRWEDSIKMDFKKISINTRN
jgi:hypothetical protein